MAAPALASSSVANGTGNTLTPSLPSGTTTGDWLRLTCSSDVTTGTVTWAGSLNSVAFTSGNDLTTDLKGGTTAGCAMHIFEVKYGGSGGLSVTRTGGSGQHSVIVERFAAADVDATNPFYVIGTPVTSNSAQPDPPAITTTVADTRVDVFVSFDEGKTLNSVSSGFTQVVYQNLSSHACVIATANQASPGSVNPGVFSLSSTTRIIAVTIGTQGPSAGSQTITGALFTNSNTFYGATVSPGAVGITGALFSNAQTFYGATISKTYRITGALFVDTDTFYGATISRGAVTVTGARYNDADTFYASTISRGTVSILGALYSDPDTFYGSTVSRGAVTITGSRYNDPDTFYAATISQGSGGQTITGARYNDSQTFYAGTVSATYTISGTRFNNANAFYAATISQASPQTVTGSLYANDNTFFRASVTQPTTAQTDRGDPGFAITPEQVEQHRKAAEQEREAREQAYARAIAEREDIRRLIEEASQGRKPAKPQTQVVVAVSPAVETKPAKRRSVEADLEKLEARARALDAEIRRNAKKAAAEERKQAKAKAAAEKLRIEQAELKAIREAEEAEQLRIMQDNELIAVLLLAA